MKKVYLETPEAVIKAMKAGKVIKDEDGYSYKLVDGFIVAADKNDFIVGDSIFSVNTPYILENEPLKIEVGKWYETRDHQKARCYYKEEPYAAFSIDNECSTIVVYLNGRLYGDREAKLDIIGPWKED